MEKVILKPCGDYETAWCSVCGTPLHQAMVNGIFTPFFSAPECPHFPLPNKWWERKAAIEMWERLHINGFAPKPPPDERREVISIE